jgi:hypothetical protein
VKRGDKIELTYDDRTVEAVVTMASDNGRSLVVEFEALLIPYIGTMPLLQQEDGSFVDLMVGRPVVVKPKL